MEVLNHSQPLCRATTLRLFLALVLAIPAAVAGGGVDEYQVKAAFLYNFAKFVEWPAGDEEPGVFVVGILGRDPFGPAIHQVVDGKTIRGRQVRVVHGEEPSDIVGSHLLFISSSEAHRLDKCLQLFEGAAVLTVGDAENFVRRGGMIALFLEGNRVRFSVNQASAQRSGLRVSSKLLALAREVISEEVAAAQ